MKEKKRFFSKKNTACRIYFGIPQDIQACKACNLPLQTYLQVEYRNKIQHHLRFLAFAPFQTNKKA